MQQHQTRSLRLSGRLCAALASKVFSGVSAVIALAIALSLAPVSQAFGQASSSSDAAGKVTDATGAAIPGATIHLINNGTGAERTATSNDAGDWSIPNVPPANYKIRVEKSGFKSAQIPALDVEIGKTANGSVTLSVGEVTDTVEVSALPPQLQTQEATVGQVIDQKQINDLPLNGRNVLQLATLAPGVSPAQQGQTGNPAQTGTRSLYITVDGGRGSSTNYVLDGTYVRSVRFNNMSIQPSTDTIQEFNLLRSTFSTEYGQGQAVVSMVTKSGSNTIHGSAYEFARNSVFDARNYFATTASNPVKPNFSRHQFGATIGGPIIKDKLFIFGGYEGLRSQRDTPLFALFPTQAQLNGDGRASATPLNPLRSDGTRCDPSQVSGPSAPRTGETCIGVNNPASLSVTNTVARALNPTYPVVTSDAQTVQGQYNYTQTRPFQDNYDSYTVRGDLILSQKQQLFGRYVNFDSSQLQPIVSGGGQLNPLLGRNAVLGHTWLLSSSIVNEARVGWNEFYNITNAVNAFPNTRWAAAEGLTNITALGNAAQDGRAAFTIQGYTNVADVGGNSGGDQGGHENIMSVGDSLSIVRGKHTFKTGFQYQNRRLWLIADNNARGAATFDNCSTSNCAAGSKTYTEPISGATVYYNKYQNYARGMCTSGCNGNVGTTRGHYRDNTYGAFFNDTWQFGHGLTLTMGLRWEYNSPWVEQNGLEGTLDPTTGLVTFSKLPTNIPAAYETLARTMTGGASGYADYSRTYRPGIVNPQRKGFMPRVGLAYEARTGTVIRAGYGIFLDNLNTNELQFTRYAAPLYFQQNLVNVPVSSLWPDPIANAANLTALPAPFSINPNNSRPYTQEWNMSLQQDLGKGMILELAYTGSNTHKLWKRYDQNMCIQVPFVLPSFATSGCTSANRPFKQFGNGVLTSSTRGDSSFNGGSVKIEKRAKGGLFYLGSYQWSKNLDNSSGEAGSNDSSYATDFRFDRSYSNFDNRHRAVISGGYELPFGKGKKWLSGPAGNAIAGGWTLQPAVQLRSGYPFNITSSGCNFANNITCRVWLAPGKTVKDAYRANPSPFNWFDATAFSGSPTTATVTLGSNGYVSSSRTLPSVQGWVTRNVLRGPGTAAVDFSAIKNFKIVERFNAQFRAEAYNILNRAIFSNPAANINTPNTLGKVSSTSIDNRSIQLAIKVLW